MELPEGHVLPQWNDHSASRGFYCFESSRTRGGKFPNHQTFRTSVRFSDSQMTRAYSTQQPKRLAAHDTRAFCHSVIASLSCDIGEAAMGCVALHVTYYGSWIDVVLAKRSTYATSCGVCCTISTDRNQLECFAGSCHTRLAMRTTCGGQQ